MSSESDFAYSTLYTSHFIVRNTTGIHELSPYKKVISIFNYPINPGEQRNLLSIPGILEEDIRASLLKGVLRHKFLCGDIELVSSNIDLLQFSDKQRDFLFQFGFTTGIQAGYPELDGYVQEILDNSGGGDIGDLTQEVEILQQQVAELQEAQENNLTADQHEILRQLIHFIDSGPGNGFTPTAYQQILPPGSIFPTSITWYVDSELTIKLVEQLITWNGIVPNIIIWNIYASDGITIINSIKDTIFYQNNIFESNRTREFS